MDHQQEVGLFDQLEQPTVQSNYSGRADINTGPVSRAVLVQWSKRPRIRHRGAAEKHADDIGTAMTAIAQSLFTGPSVTLSKTHLTPQEVAKWIAHQRTQKEAETFDSCTLTTHRKLSRRLQYHISNYLIACQPQT